MTKVAVVLSGCGVFDGSEIYESVLTLLRLDQVDAEVQCFAPNIQQMHVINHGTGEEAVGETRNVLTEAARLARGEITDLAQANANEFDALIVPGGFGAAKNLSDFAVKGAECSVNEDLKRFAQAMNAQGKPVGFICIAPAMVPHIFGQGTKCTIGNDADTAAAINAMGGEHHDCRVDDVVIDQQRKIVTTPAYMLASRITEAEKGINKLIDTVLNMVS